MLICFYFCAGLCYYLLFKLIKHANFIKLFYFWVNLTGKIYETFCLI